MGEKWYGREGSDARAVIEKLAEANGEDEVAEQGVIEASE